MREVVEVIDGGRRITAEVERALAQFSAALSADYGDWAVTERQREERARAYAERLSTKVADIKSEWLPRAYSTLGRLAANPTPATVQDKRARFVRLHQLVAMPLPDRLAALNTAVETSDVLTFDVACTAPPFAKLIPPAELDRAKSRWAARHSIHPHPLHGELNGLIAEVVAGLTQLERAIARPAAGVMV